MATNKYKGATQLSGITGQQSGDDLTIVQQKNAVIRVKRITAKRRRRVVVPALVVQLINILVILILNHLNNGSN